MSCIAQHVVWLKEANVHEFGSCFVPCPRVSAELGCHVPGNVHFSSVEFGRRGGRSTGLACYCFFLLDISGQEFFGLVSQVGSSENRNLVKVFRSPEISRVKTDLLERRVIVRNILIGVRQKDLQLSGLQLLQFVFFHPLGSLKNPSAALNLPAPDFVIYQG